MAPRFAASFAAVSIGVGMATAATSAQCSVYRINVPDFDQRRDPAPGIMGLPGNGNCYCVPTSVMNWLAYASNFGFPNLLNGPRNWQSNAHYEDVTDYLALMGLLMGTGDGADPDGGGPLPANSCGSGATGFTNGANGWINSFYPGEFVVFTVGTNGTDTLTPQEMYSMEAFGGLVAMCYSRWNILPANVPLPGLPQRFVRQPVGHCISLTRVTNACGPVPALWYRDPAGFDGGDTDQAPFVTQKSDMVAVPGFYAGNAAAAPVFRTMWRFADVTSNISMLDSAWVITPIHGLSALPQAGQVSLVGMWDFDLTFPAPTVQPIQQATGVHAVAMSTMPGQACAVVSTSTGNQLVALQFESPRLPPVSTQLRTLSNAPGPMAYDRNGILYLADGNHILKLDTTTRPATVMNMITVPSLPVALSHNDRTGGMVALFDDATPGGSVGLISEAGVLSMLPLTSTRVESDSSIAAARTEDVFYIATPSVGTIYRATRNSAGGLTGVAIASSMVVEPRNVQCTHQDQLLFTNGPAGAAQTVMALEFQDSSGLWVVDTNNALLGSQVGAMFSIATSRQYSDDLFDIDTQQSVELPVDNGPGVPDCIADFDADGTVAVPDIFAFLSRWFAGDLFADVDFDDDTDVPDIFFFLSLWFAGC